MLLARQSSLLPFLSSLWGVYEPWRHSPTSAAAIIPPSPKSKDHEDFWNDLKGTAVMWDFTKIECNTIYSRDGISRYRWSPAFSGEMCFFFSERIRVERNLSREDDFGWNNSSHERADREPNKSKPEIHSLEPGEFPSLQTLTIYTRKYTTKHKDTRWIIISECFPEYESLLKRWTGVTLKIYLKKKPRILGPSGRWCARRSSETDTFYI